MEDDEAAWAGTLLSGHPTKTPGPPSYRAGKNLACTPPSLLQGKQECTHHSPPGQARMHTPLSSRASKTLSKDSQGPSAAGGLLSSRAGKTISKTSKSLLLPGKQGRSGHPLPGQARTSQTPFLPAPSSYRATKSPIRDSHQVPSPPLLQGKQGTRAMLVQGNQAPQWAKRPPRALPPATRCLAFPPPRPSPGLLALEETWVPPPHGKSAQGQQAARALGTVKHYREQNRVVTTLHCGRDREYWEIEAKKGLPSADRNNKATLLLTGPFRTAKSSAKDLIPHPPKLQYASRRRALPARRGVRLLRCEAGAYSHAPEACGRCRRVPARILT